MAKKLTLTVEIQEKNTPQNFTFEAGVSGVEQLAIGVIVKNLADMKIQEMLNPKPH